MHKTFQAKRDIVDKHVFYHYHIGLGYAQKLAARVTVKRHWVLGNNLPKRRVPQIPLAINRPGMRQIPADVMRDMPRKRQKEQKNYKRYQIFCQICAIAYNFV